MERIGRMLWSRKKVRDINKERVGVGGGGEYAFAEIIEIALMIFQWICFLVLNIK